MELPVAIHSCRPMDGIDQVITSRDIPYAIFFPFSLDTYPFSTSCGRTLGYGCHLFYFFVIDRPTSLWAVVEVFSHIRYSSGMAGLGGWTGLDGNGGNHERSIRRIGSVLRRTSHDHPRLFFYSFFRLAGSIDSFSSQAKQGFFSFFSFKNVQRAARNERNSTLV